MEGAKAGMDWLDISKAKDVEQVREAVTRLDVNEVDEQGRTPLILFMTYRMPIEGVRCLLEHGPDLEKEDRLGKTALKKAVKFKQIEAVKLLVESGARLDSPQGIQGTAWQEARGNPRIADLLLDTQGAVRLTLTEQEQEQLEAILYEESMDVVISRIRQLDSDVLLHAVVNEYNWDDGPEPMQAVFEHPACAEITMLDMYELMEADYWLSLEPEEVNQRMDGAAYTKLALSIKEKCSL